ncbi:peptidylprolyl isomerase [Paenibacillus roseipurpureus]|uniref:peptidylprolyl isomerase n=1 Tax=Paenibacillus roseopurpureus TaxID=2918901 RepID=A0AA96RM11_9BACL|nr:SurA N-terminal domain-containing protein [Paenibacillus sp. MBLB1832]WNR45979.1 SurA N-terminal domain-containing protein [Paenibacillus sp. MBLB1832]
MPPRKMKWKMVPWIVGMAAVGVISAWVTLSHTGMDKYAIVAKVNDTGITAEDLETRMSYLRNDTVQYFKRTYQAEVNRDFWDRRFGNENPLAYIRKLALDDLVREKLEQQLAVQYGIDYISSTDDLHQKLIKENKRRAEAVKQGKPIYGLMQYDEKTYASYLRSNMLIQLKQVLSQSLLVVTDKEAEVSYQSQGSEGFRLPGLIRMDRYSIPFLGKDGGIELGLKAEAESAMNNLYLQASKGEDLAGAAAKWNENANGISNLRIKHQELTFEPKNRRSDQVEYPELLDWADKLEQGGLSPVLMISGEIVVFRLTQKSTGDVQAFHLVKEQIKNRLLDEKFELLIQDMRSHAETQIQEQVYENVKME